MTELAIQFVLYTRETFVGREITAGRLGTFCRTEADEKKTLSLMKMRKLGCQKNWSNFFFPSRSYKLCQHQPLPPLIPQLFGTHPQVYLWAISRQVNRTNQDFELHFLLSCLDNQANGKPCPISSLTQFTSPILCPAVISTPRNFDFTP